jgi:hypothetical protein
MDRTDPHGAGVRDSAGATEWVGAGPPLGRAAARYGVRMGLYADDLDLLRW